jgi:hypothetical protein
MAPKGKEDPIARIQAMIEESISRHESARDQRDLEAKDPWKRLEGMIDRSVGKHFESFAKSLDEAEAAEGGAESGAGGGKTKAEPSFFEQLGLV